MIIAGVIVVLLLFFYSFALIAGNVSMKDGSGSSAVYSLAGGTVLELDDGWSAYSDRALENPVDLSPGVFKTGNYYWKISLETSGMLGRSALMINPIYSAYRLWINGEPISVCGKPSGDCEQLSLLRSSVVSFEQRTDELEIIIQVSNSNHFYGGSMLNWLTYGRYPDIMLRSQQGEAL